MTYIWSYVLVALCMTVTSSRVMDSHGNRNNHHGNAVSDVKGENDLAPPSNNGFNIDSNDYHLSFPGNPNEKQTKSQQNLDCNELCERGEDGEGCLCQWPSFLKDIATSIQNSNTQSNGYQIVPFEKDEISALEGSDLCKAMCISGINRPPCKCE